VRTGHYREVRVALVSAFAADVGARWTDELAEAWHSAYDRVAEARCWLLAGTRLAARPRIAPRHDE
jgi:hemoglobin-like flavoprotein